MGKPKQPLVPVLISERMIEHLPPTVLVDYVQMRLLIRNGVVFGAQRFAAKMGWGERRAYQCLAAQKHHGLMFKDEFGHHRQAMRKDVNRLFMTKKKLSDPEHTHKTTLRLKTTSTRQQIADELKMKLAECRFAQFQWAQDKAKAFDTTSHRLRSKIIGDGFKQENIWVRPEDHPAEPDLLELGAGEVSMTVTELARTTMQSERSTYRWKKRVRGRLSQRNRTVVLPPSVSSSLDEAPEWTSVMSDAWKGALIRGKKGWKLVLPNTYRVKTSYKKPVVKKATKYQNVLEYLREYDKILKRYEEQLRIEYPWYVEALANPW